MNVSDSDAFLDLLVENPIIGAIRKDSQLERVLDSNIKIVFVLYGTILSIKEQLARLKAKDKIVFIHLDMIDGLKNDEAGIEYIKEIACPFGVITTRQQSIKHAKSFSLFTILRMFIIDSKSLTTGLKNIDEFKPHAVEVMPGASSKIIKTVQKSIDVPIIAGGLIETKEEVVKTLNSGAIAISTSYERIWNI